jgi:hypothetical protein
MSHAESYPFDPDRLPKPVLEGHPEWVELHDFAWTLAAEKTRMSRGRWHLNTAWGSGDEEGWNYQWVWDTAFMILWARYGGGALPSIESFDNFYDLQRDDGYISMTYDYDTEKEPYPNRINPPLFAWVEWEYYLTTGDRSRFEWVVPHIEKHMAWIEANRTNSATGSDEPKANAGHEGTLYWFADCGSSGMDDSPRTPRLPEAGRFYQWIDLSSQVAHAYSCLARMHGALGNDEGAEALQVKAKVVGAEPFLPRHPPPRTVRLRQDGCQFLAHFGGDLPDRPPQRALRSPQGRKRVQHPHARPHPVRR